MKVSQISSDKSIKEEHTDSGRRNFIKKSLAGSLTFLTIPFYGNILSVNFNPARQKKKGFDLSLDVPAKLFDGQRCWAHPRAGIIPGAGQNGLPRIVMTMNTADLSGSDVFRGMFGMKTDDLGRTWDIPVELKNMGYRYEEIKDVKRPVAASDFWPAWHAPTKTLLGTGHTVAYTPEWKVMAPGPLRPRDTTFSVYDPASNNWSEWQKLRMPENGLFYDSGAGCVQRYDENDGTILLPVYYVPVGQSSRVTVTRCKFDGKELTYQEHGNELAVDNGTRGLHEPSLKKFRDKYFMTIRNDKLAFITKSSDGLQFDPIKPWKFDDGSDLGSYNTQAHWVAHSEALYLVYTRRGADNDHVARNRAPLFMAQVDTEKLCVIRSSEVALTPNRGAQQGNFGVVDISREETWVTTSEWMQPRGVEKYGSDGSIFIARIHWKKTNRLFK
jgi:hypothetical protein